MNNENKLSHIIELPNLNFKTQMNIPIDANAHIKTIINIQPYLFDTKLECVNSKCEVKGKIGAKIIYLDIDNVYNTLTGEISFAENVLDNNLTGDVQVLMSNEQISSSVSFDDLHLKIDLSVNAKLVGNINLNLNLCDTENPDLISKKQTITTCCSVDKIDARNNLETNIKLPYRANKILNIAICPVVSKVESNSNYVTISGNSTIQVLYDVDSDTSCELKYFCNSYPFKYEVQANSNSDSIANVSLHLDNSSINFSCELNESETDIALDYDIVTNGFVFNPLSIEYCDDIYSTSSQIDTTFSEREFDNIQPLLTFGANVDGELQIADSTQIDEIISCINHSCLITQCYNEQNSIVLEGVITSNLIYMNEERQVLSLNCELPFSVSKNVDLDCKTLNFDAVVVNCKTKIKRGNILALDYEIEIMGYTNVCKQAKMLSTIKYGEKIEYGDIAFQICVAKNGENLWDFCKRTHTTESQIKELNKEIPPVFQGGEKILIFR